MMGWCTWSRLDGRWFPADTASMAMPGQLQPCEESGAGCASLLPEGPGTSREQNPSSATGTE